MKLLFMELRKQADRKFLVVLVLIFAFAFGISLNGAKKYNNQVSSLNEMSLYNAQISVISATENAQSEKDADRAAYYEEEAAAYSELVTAYENKDVSAVISATLRESNNEVSSNKAGIILDDESFNRAKKNVAICSILAEKGIKFYHSPYMEESYCDGAQAVTSFLQEYLFLLVSNYKLGIALASGAGIGYLISYLSRKQIIRSSREVNAAMKSDNQVLNEYIDAIEIDKQNDVGDYFTDRCKNSLWKFINTSVRVDKKQIFLRNLINHFHQIFSIGVTIYLMMASENTTGQIVFFMMVADIIIEKSVSFENSIYAIHRTLPSFENIEMINALEKPDEGMEVSKIKKIELKNLFFWYENAESSLIKNLNAEFRSGDIVRVAGKNGSGKSTILKLLSGLLTAKEGEIRYNGVDIRDISGSSLRKEILSVAQDEVMLNEPLEDYLRIIRSGTFHEEEYRKLLKELDVDIHTDCITDSGKKLSNGQRKKRLMIKLLLYCKEASVILIDEIDAGLDIKTREKWNIIEKEIIKQNPECILFKISHDAVDDLDFYTRTLEL